MKIENENVALSSGIYAIFDLLNKSIYIGQAKEFRKRTHLDDLEKGNDNNEGVQKLYNQFDGKRDLIYFVVCYFEDSNYRKKTLNEYEQLCILLMENLGFNVYNGVKNDEKNRLHLMEKYPDVYKDIEENFCGEFKFRFGIEVKDIQRLSNNELEKALDFYFAKRACKDMYESDYVFMSKDRIKKIFGNSTVKLEDLQNTDEFIYSSAGGYIGEGIDQILGYEIKEIKESGYCLWTFSKSALSYDFVQKRVDERLKNGKKTYVVFSYTVSTELTNVEAVRADVLDRNSYKIFHNNMELLDTFKFIENGKKIYIPENIDCTAAGKNGAKAFVISNLKLLEDMNSKAIMDVIDKNYTRYVSTGEYEGKKQFYVSTNYYVNKDGKNMDISLVPADKLKKGRTFCFVGELIYPYIVEIVPDNK